MDYDILNTLLKKYVCTVVFTKLDGTQRRIVATNNMEVLESDIGVSILKYKRPTNGPMYDVRAHNNIICWDCQKMAWRTIKATDAEVEDSISPKDFIRQMKILYGQATKVDKMLDYLKNIMGRLPVFKKWNSSLRSSGLQHPDTIKWDS